MREEHVGEVGVLVNAEGKHKQPSLAADWVVVGGGGHDPRDWCRQTRGGKQRGRREVGELGGAKQRRLHSQSKKKKKRGRRRGRRWCPNPAKPAAGPTAH